MQVKAGHNILICDDLQQYSRKNCTAAYSIKPIIVTSKCLHYMTFCVYTANKEEFSMIEHLSILKKSN